MPCSSRTVFKRGPRDAGLVSLDPLHHDSPRRTHLGVCSTYHPLVRSSDSLFMVQLTCGNTGFYVSYLALLSPRQDSYPLLRPGLPGT